jgi:hypothetical protein
LLRLGFGNNALQLAPNEAGATAILSGGELIDRLQHIAWNVADRQDLNSGPLCRWSNGSVPFTSSCLKIELTAPPPAIRAAKVVIVLLIFIDLIHLLTASPGMPRRSVEKSVGKIQNNDPVVVSSFCLWTFAD